MAIALEQINQLSPMIKILDLFITCPHSRNIRTYMLKDLQIVYKQLTSIPLVEISNFLATFKLTVFFHIGSINVVTPVSHYHVVLYYSITRSPKRQYRNSGEIISHAHYTFVICITLLYIYI
jgi:hypothetical protein